MRDSLASLKCGKKAILGCLVVLLLFFTMVPSVGAAGIQVIYNKNNYQGSAPTDNNTYVSGATVTVLDKGGVYNGSDQFAGWNTTSNGTGTTYATGATFTIGAASVTLYATFFNSEDNPRNVLYDANSGDATGDVPTDDTPYPNGVVVTPVYGNTGGLARDGYTFAGWNTQEDGNGTNYTGGSMLTIPAGSSDFTLYAKWTPAPTTYTVTYNDNNSDSGNVPVDGGTYMQGATVTVKDNTGLLEKAGYTFAGWNTQADGEGTGYAVGSTLTMGTANVILYAKWTLVPPTYTVTYNDSNSDSGSGNVPVDGGTYMQGAAVTVKDNTGLLEKAGYTFAGWNTQADGEGTGYAVGSTLTMGTTNVTLYAKWTPVPPTYTVTYNGNNSDSGNVPVDGGSYVQGAAVAVYGNTGNLMRSGYTFAGWNTQADGNGTSYAASSTLTMGTANVMLYAKWAPVAPPTYTVTYSGNGSTSGNAPVDSGTYEQGVTVSVYGNTGNLMRSGYTFAGWNTQADGNGTGYAVGSTLTVGAANVTLYAKWAPVVPPTYSVTYSDNGSTSGNAPVDSGTYEQGVTVTVYGNTGNLMRSGYTFAGWNTQADGNGTGYAVGSTLTMGTTNVTLYAKWTPVAPPTYTVTYSDNGSTSGNAPVDSGTYEQGVTVTVYGNTGNLIRSGYTFAGWNTQADGNGTGYAVGNTLTVGAANVTLYAKWTYFATSSTSSSPAAAPANRLVLESNPNVTGDSAKTEITQIVGQNLSMSAQLMTVDGKTLNIPEFSINSSGQFNLANVPAGEYKIALSVVAPSGEKLAGKIGKLTVQSNGSATLESDLIDPYGVITDELTGEKLEGVKVSLHWLDTALNRSKGRTPDGLVVLPELPDFAPNKNHDPQWSTSDGRYGWMVFPDGDYYILADKTGYETFDSRKDMRNEQQGDDSYIKGGVIHVGQSIVQYNFAMISGEIESGEHQPYMVGYPDGLFHPERGITRSEVAAILSRIIPVSAQAAESRSFPDVDRSHWAAAEIMTATEQHWMEGYQNGNFAPEKQVTRAELAQIILNVKKWDKVKESSFTDVAGHWAEPAIAAVEQEGVISGYPDGSFRPDQIMAREEAVKIFNHILNRQAQPINVAPKWPDVPETHWNYKEIMEASVQHHYKIYKNGKEEWQLK
ncbi:InlB B-repeat-containing protein [Paenibacillus thalictri]|uniref:SLH domain-containing protein n=1 Tax=Paenibacillus thalictri TaxID=2527873 RepID=A0A4Q9DH20_9BACL|nr:InlB B-repeat-containing protein [Paenibacillus thalictri]TBL71094.1 hypothetical protein EYB31_31630 [Paenibacillus thalictri]